MNVNTHRVYYGGHLGYLVGSGQRLTIEENGIDLHLPMPIQYSCEPEKPNSVTRR